MVRVGVPSAVMTMSLAMMVAAMGSPPLKTLRGVVVIGEDRAPLVEALQAGAPDVPRVEVDGHEDWMFSVVNEAVALSMPGDTVVLAPACASWDQFDNYGQRGDAFADAVSRLEDQWGSAGGDE